jgi:hypothetical protein
MGMRGELKAQTDSSHMPAFQPPAVHAQANKGLEKGFRVKGFVVLGFETPKPPKCIKL